MSIKKEKSFAENTSKKKKNEFTNVARFLSEDYSVLNMAYYCGFSECSSFMGLFKMAYNVTSVKYKKNCKSKNSDCFEALAL